MILKLISSKKRIMIAYFKKMKYRGKPYPRNYSYLEFSHKATGSLFTLLKQQIHSERYYYLVLIPGFVDSPC
jgi:hypothetical protein